MATFIQAALAEAQRRGVGGKPLTPFLLSHIVEATGGRSLATNIALVKNNARLAARLASALGGA
jgi:pseudouridine-5'-phosphate glycosidase